MKYLILSFLLLLCCTAIEDNVVSPVICYCIDLSVSSTSGVIISNETSTIFVDNPESIIKWKDYEGINVTKDSINSLYNIKIIQCINPDTKQWQN